MVGWDILRLIVNVHVVTQVTPHRPCLFINENKKGKR